MFYFRNSLKEFLLAILFILSQCYFPNKIIAFTDDFTLDPRTNPNWDVQNPSGLVFDNPGITLSSSTGSFPYLKTSVANSLIGNRYHEITFQYLSNSSDWGVGASFSDNSPNYPTYLGPVSDYLKYNIVYFFGNHLHSVSTICPKENQVCPNNWWFIYPNSPPTNNYLPSTSRDFNLHKISVVRTDLDSNLFSYKSYLDNNLIVETQPTTRIINSIWLGHPSDLGTSRVWPSLRIISVKSLPTAPPTFPYLSQKDPQWASKEYDSATTWAGIDKSGINRWGCALTSVAMILQNYDVKTVTGEPVTPDNLNSWLKSQPDGYIGPGLLNWLAVTRFAKQSYDAGNAPKKLEYVRSYLPSALTLPAILGTGTHFVVAHSEDTINWVINDPASIDTKTLTKTASIKSINRFVQSETDLSYMMFILSASDSAILKDASNNPIDITWVEESLSDDVDNTTMTTMKVGMVAKPSTANYLLTVNRPGPSSSEVKVYLYDQAANPILQTIVLDEQVTNLRINYSKELSIDTTITELDLTPPLTPTVIAPSNGTYVKPVGLILDWSDVTDPSSPVTYKYKSSWVGGSYGPVSAGIVSEIDASGTADGEYMWQVQACDGVNNCSDWSSPTKVVVDSTAPSSDIVFPNPGPSSNYFEVVYSELVEPIEATDGANYYLSNWPGAGGSGDLVGDANISYNPISSTSRVVFTSPDWYISPEQLWGVQNIHDLAGNVLAVNPYIEYSTPPTTPVINTPTITTNPTNNLNQTWSWLPGSDIGSGIKGYSTKTYDVVAEKYLSGWLWIGQVLGTSTTLGEGQWQLSLQATDNAGNTSEIKTSVTLTIDTTSPSVPTNLHFANPAVSCGGFTNSKNITFDWDDATDNRKIAGYEYNVDYPLWTNRGSWTTFFTTSSYRGSLNEGIHYLKLRSKDTAGNYSAWSNSCTVTYDSIIPRLNNKTTFDGWYNKPQTSEFSFEDINLAPDYARPTCEIRSEGLNQACQVTPNACDKAGNCYSNTLTSNLVNIDFTKPVVSLNAWGSTIDGTTTDNLSGLDKVEIRIRKPDQNEVTVSATGTANWTYTMTDPSMGEYKIVVLAYDKAGNLNDEVSKEFVMSPATQENARASNENNETVLGATTTGPKSIKRIALPEPIFETIADEVKQQKSVTESPTDGNVLGETDTQPPKSNTYLWIFAGCTLGLVALLWFIFRVKRQS